jgi:hypothetical protein
VRASLQQVDATMKSLAAEKGTALVDKLNAKEAKELTELTSNVTNMQKVESHKVLRHSRVLM